jgi:hypothetical protein
VKKDAENVKMQGPNDHNTQHEEREGEGNAGN